MWKEELNSSPSRENNGSHSVNEEGNISQVEKKQASPTSGKGKKSSSNHPEELDTSISKFEEEILSLLVGQELYGLQIIQAFENASGGKRKVSIGSLYPTLSRLEEKGFITSRMADRPTDDKGGARRKYFKITRRGVFALTEAEQFRQRLSSWQVAT
jgi:DNA-binding PadR family transcriptional regulator